MAPPWFLKGNFRAQHRASPSAVAYYRTSRVANRQFSVAANIRKQLADLGVVPSVLDYVASALTWPTYRVLAREDARRHIGPRRSPQGSRNWSFGRGLFI